ncbi:hypothetical protein V6N12_035188 [Hibiscus sabdariffa]|uniref:Uncharacterized protein n=1 Tax=Hibiscus sabdariffa TaxID=183260 RepID=A0ABR2ADN7_9ROSI
MLHVFSDISAPPTALPSSVGADNSRPDVDPLNPGRIVDPPIDAMSEMDVSDPVQIDKQHFAASPSPPSYKDTLMASESHQPVTADIFDDDEVVLLEGDVTRSDVDGLISIQFSKRVQALAMKNLELTVVIKLLGRRIGYNTLRSRLCDLW